MNEPDEELESHVPEEPLPERDVLLEALVDQETEAAPRRRISKTLIAACLLTGLGVWQIVHVSNGGEPIFRVAAKAKAAPTKLRSDGRRPIGKVLPSTDPIATYLERAKRGMTDQEIRWMITDFQAAGLDQVDRSPKGTLRAKQQLWYLEALTEALQLSSEQKNQARARMDELLKEDLAAYGQGIAGVTSVKEATEAIPREIPIAPYADSGTWLLKEAYAPWELCDLTKEQDQLTMHRWRAAEQQPILWLQLARTKQDPVSGNLIELDEVDPFAPGLPKILPSHREFELMDVFPLTPDQKYPNAFGFGSSIQQARGLQPSQLRILMLLEPDASGVLLEQLDYPTTQTQVTEYPGTGITTEPNELPPNTIEPETPVDPLPEPDPK